MFFNRKKKSASQLQEEHAVITHLPLSDDDFGNVDERELIFELEDRIGDLIDRVGGEHDGHAFGDGEAILYTYGRNADEIFQVLQDALVGFILEPGAYAIKRYGDADNPNAREERVALGAV